MSASSTAHVDHKAESPLTRVLGIRHPIVQGALARISYAELAAAVSNAGGLGQVAVGGLESPDALREVIRKTKALTDKPFAVNIPLGRRKADPWLDVIIDEGVSVMSFSGGNPRPYMERVKREGLKALIMVASPEMAKKAESIGADVIAAVGFEGGGHIGRSDTTTILMAPLVCQAVSIPVLVGGGIADGRGIAAAMALGADGVLIGTRFAATKEACAHDVYKNAMVTSRETDTVVIKRSIGMPARILRSEWASDILEAEKRGATFEEIIELVKGEVNERAVRYGDLDQSISFAGAAVGLIDDVPGAGELVARLMAETREAMDSAQYRLKQYI